MISVVVNCDTRPGWQNAEALSRGCLNGCHSADFLTAGLVNKLRFFRGEDVQLIVYVDVHEPVSPFVAEALEAIVVSSGNDSLLICAPTRPRVHPRWSDLLTLEAMAYARGEYLVHFDADAAAFRADDSPIIANYKGWLNDGKHKFICQPAGPDSPDMYWASTRFFICRREWWNEAEIRQCFANDYLHGKYGQVGIQPRPCCLEHTLGVMAGPGAVLYPPHEPDYLVFSWSRYYRGTLARLNALPFEAVRDYILRQCEMHGPNDVNDTPTPP